MSGSCLPSAWPWRCCCCSAAGSFCTPAARALSQWDIDNAVQYTMSHTDPPPAETTIAAATVGPSVVRVEGYMSPEHAAEVAKEEAKEAKKEHKPVPLQLRRDGKDDDKPDSTGTGVVIDDKGDILTNLHVIHSTDRWVVTFCGRQQVRSHRGQCPAGKRSGGDPRQDLARRSQARDPGLDRRSQSRRHGGGGGLSLRHRPVGLRPAWWRG